MFIGICFCFPSILLLCQSSRIIVLIVVLCILRPHRALFLRDVPIRQILVAVALHLACSVIGGEISYHTTGVVAVNASDKMKENAEEKM